MPSGKDSNYFYQVNFNIENNNAEGTSQSASGGITMVVWKRGAVSGISLVPYQTSVAKGKTKQFEVEWRAAGDVDKNDVTWFIYDGQAPTSSATTISNNGLLTIGEDETKGQIWVKIKHNATNKETNSVVSISDHEHTLEHVDAKAKTCTEDGNIEHYKCTHEGCIAKFKDNTVMEQIYIVTISAGHEYGTLIAEQPATCSSTGMSAHYKCSVCNALFNSDKEEKTETDLVIAKSSHTFGDLVSEVPATCESNGTKAYKDCSVCHKHFDAEGNEITENFDTWKVIPAGHKYGTLIAEQPATCTNTGVQAHYECSSCHKLFDSSKVEKTSTELVIDKITHNYGSLIVERPATCTSTGTQAHYECSSCHKLFDSNKVEKSSTELVINKSSHTFGDWQAEVPATTENTGIKAHKDCSVCHDHFDADGNKIDDLTIPKITVSTEPTEPTDPTKPSEEEKNSLSGGAIAGIVVGSVAVAGIGGFAIFWFVIKKKKWADLVAIFKK